MGISSFFSPLVAIHGLQQSGDLDPGYFGDPCVSSHCVGITFSDVTGTVLP